MRALLIYPPISKLERYSSDIGHSGGNQIPLGLYYIAAYVREKKHEVDVVDAEANNLAGTDLVSRIDRFKPGIVGISSTTVAHHRAIEVAEEIKERFPDMPIVLGGPHVSSNVRYAMSPECFDYGVLNEGEVTFLRLLDTLESGGVIGDIEGLVFRENGRLIENPRRDFIEDLDTLPFPAYDLIPDISTYTPPPNNYVKMPVANLITS